MEGKKVGIVDRKVGTGNISSVKNSRLIVGKKCESIMWKDGGQ